MATIDQLSEFHIYFKGVMARANCHALNVNQVLPLLAGVVIEHVDMAVGLQVKTYRGDYANVAWIRHNGHRYAFTYDHDRELIVLRSNTLRGKELTTFENSDDFASVTLKIKTEVK